MKLKVIDSLDVLSIGNIEEVEVASEVMKMVDSRSVYMQKKPFSYVSASCFYTLLDISDDEEVKVSVFEDEEGNKFKRTFSNKYEELIKLYENKE